jgi:hypothetical protein
VQSAHDIGAAAFGFVSICFVAPAAFGVLEEPTGSVQGGLYGLATASLLGAVTVYFARGRPQSGSTGAVSTVTG